jgi:DNA helicase-2/ATP-dependent DNA helicase PcrA
VDPDRRDSPPLPPAVAERLARLAPDQRAAATAPPGPVLCIAPAGSGKTTTLVARVAWLVATGIDPATIAAITFNARAAEELRERLGPALAQLGPTTAPPGELRERLGPALAQPGPTTAPPAGPPADHASPACVALGGASHARAPAGGAGTASGGPVRVRTFHALGLEILRDAGRAPNLVPRERVLRDMLPGADAAANRRRLDDAFSRLKLDLGVTAEEVAGDPAPGPVARAFLAYERALAAAGGIDFDDLVAGALRALEGSPALLARWRSRCAHLLVDEVQDVDRSQLRLALLLAAPANRVFLVGDDDQSIYGWRLADVRRVLSLGADLPGLRRVDLAVNYRCPAPVLARAVRLIENNLERFAKTIRAGPGATGPLILAPAPGWTDPLPRLLASWPRDGTSRAVLARTRRELLPAVAACLAAGIAFRADGVPLPLEDTLVDDLVAAAASSPARLPVAARVAAAARRAPTQTEAAARVGASVQVDATTQAAARMDPSARVAATARVHPVPPPAPAPEDPDPDPAWTAAEIAAAVIGWAVRLAPGDDLASAVADARARLAELRRPDARLTLATAHGTKGLEWDHVAVLGMTEGRFPSARSLAEAADPTRALEEERRLAYVAWTRARRSLTLVYDPAAPSPFLLEAFDEAELGLDSPGATPGAPPSPPP